MGIFSAETGIKFDKMKFKKWKLNRNLTAIS